MHASAPYDPKKAHEYYLRTRKLKGRKKGASQPLATARVGTTKTAPKIVPKHTQIEQLSPQQKAELRAYAAQRVQAAQQKVTELNKKLKEAMAEAKKSADKKPTAADKHEKAREAKKYRQEHKQELKTKAKRAAA